MKIHEEFNETHTPRIKVEESRVEISFGPHPMEETHYIHWVELYQLKGELKLIGRVEFSPGVKPFTVFELKEKPESLVAFAYCNIHGIYENKWEND